MSTLVQAFNVRKGHRRAVRVRRVRPHRKRDGGSKLPLDSPDDTLELAHPRELPERFLTPKAHRAAIYSASHAKLGITPDSTLETQWGELPSELVELVASHLHPRDVVRLRCVSSGWRAALWQERVIRASLRSCGPRIDELQMFILVKRSARGLDALDKFTDNPWARGRPCTIRWEPVLNSMEPWEEFAHRQTHCTLIRICTAMVPLTPNPTVEKYLEESDELNGLAKRHPR